MNENLEKDKIQLGQEKPQLLPSKLLLNTIKLGYDIEPIPAPPEIHINFIEGESVTTTISTGFDIKLNPPPPEHHIDFVEGDSVITTISTGFEHNDKPIPPPPDINLNCKLPKRKNPDSVIETIDTGFGCDNQLVKDCPKPQYKTHLCKENYLSEFKTESEKQLARNNLGVYSKEEINDILSKIVENNNKQFVTKGEVESMIGNLDFVNSTLRSHADYEIPSDLFKL